MNNFTFSYPTKVYFGEGGARQAFGEELGRVGETVMLAYGGGSVKRNGVYDEMKTLLERAGKKVVDFSGIMPNPTYAKAQEGAALAREKEWTSFPLWAAAASSTAAKWFPRRHRCPKISGTWSTAKENFPWQGPIFGTAASFAVLDPAYTMSVPPAQVFSGAFDTLSHAMETYLGISDQDNVSDDIALAVMKNTVINMRRLLRDINDRRARSNLMWDSAMAENGILKCGRQTDFQAHQIEHQLGAYTDCNHGQGLAVIHPAYYRHIVKDTPEKFTRFAKVVFDADTAEAGVEALENFIRECGLPTKMSQLKSTVEITPEVLRQVADTCNMIKTGPRELDRDEIDQILTECM